MKKSGIFNRRIFVTTAAPPQSSVRAFGLFSCAMIVIDD